MAGSYPPESSDTEKLHLAELTVELQRDRIQQLQRALEDVIYVRRGLERAETTLNGLFSVNLPCPQCEGKTLFGYLLVDANGRHQHTRYICRQWVRMERNPEGNIIKVGEPCGWNGWTVQ